jgi:hypothetical protein
MVYLILFLPFLLFSSDFTTMPVQKEEISEIEDPISDKFLVNSNNYQKNMEKYVVCMDGAREQSDFNKCTTARINATNLFEKERQAIFTAINLKREADQYKATYNALKNGEILVEKDQK